jgi:hypothetical protein
MAITFADIGRQVANWLEGTAGSPRVEAFDAMSEGVPQVPLVRVYVISGQTDSGSEDTDRASFGNQPIRRSTCTLQVDAIARQRSHIGEDMAAQMAMIDAIDARLCELGKPPLFGLQGIQAARWSWERMAYTVSETVEYVGVRFEIVVSVF